jgi:cysteine desulfurase/selenocysteine lyase
MTDPRDFLAPARPSAGIYLANAAHGLPSAPVLDAMIGFLRDEAELGGARALARHAAQMTAGYAAAARLIGAGQDDVAFLDSGNSAIRALILSAGLAPGDHVLVDRTCWGGTLDMLASIDGIVIDVMPVDGFGRADPVATRAMAHPRTRCILLTWCPATGGIVNPAAAIGALASDIGALFFIDACQLLGQRPIDVRALGCHGLAASGRKWLRGPRGTALLYASRALLDQRPAFMADQIGRPLTDARRYEQGEAFFAGRLALGVAIGGALAIGLDRIADHVGTMAAALRDGLRAIPGVRVLDEGDDLSAIVTFVVEGQSPDETVLALARQDIHIAALSATYTPFDFAARGLTKVARAAPQIYTHEQDLERMLTAVAAQARVD